MAVEIMVAGKTARVQGKAIERFIVPDAKVSEVFERIGRRLAIDFGREAISPPYRKRLPVIRRVQSWQPTCAVEPWVRPPDPEDMYRTTGGEPEVDCCAPEHHGSLPPLLQRPDGVWRPLPLDPDKKSPKPSPGLYREVSIPLLHQRRSFNTLAQAWTEPGQNRRAILSALDDPGRHIVDPMDGATDEGPILDQNALALRLNELTDDDSVAEPDDAAEEDVADDGGVEQTPDRVVAELDEELPDDVVAEWPSDDVVAERAPDDPVRRRSPARRAEKSGRQKGTAEVQAGGGRQHRTRKKSRRRAT